MEVFVLVFRFRTEAFVINTCVVFFGDKERSMEIYVVVLQIPAEVHECLLSWFLRFRGEAASTGEGVYFSAKQKPIRM